MKLQSAIEQLKTQIDAAFAEARNLRFRLSPILVPDKTGVESVGKDAVSPATSTIQGDIISLTEQAGRLELHLRATVDLLDLDPTTPDGATNVVPGPGFVQETKRR